MKHSPRTIQIGLIKRQINRNTKLVAHIRKSKGVEKVLGWAKLEKNFDKAHEMAGQVNNEGLNIEQLREGHLIKNN